MHKVQTYGISHVFVLIKRKLAHLIQPIHVWSVLVLDISIKFNNILNVTIISVSHKELVTTSKIIHCVRNSQWQLPRTKLSQTVIDGNSFFLFDRFIDCFFSFQLNLGKGLHASVTDNLNFFHDFFDVLFFELFFVMTELLLDVLSN